MCGCLKVPDASGGKGTLAMAEAKSKTTVRPKTTVRSKTIGKSKTTGKSKPTAKTMPTAASVDDYLQGIADPERQKDCRTLVKLMTKVTGKKPVMWGPGIVGFDSYRYHYDSGREGDSCLLGFASRKTDLTIYVVSGFGGVEPLLAELGKCKTAKACLYVKRLADIDLGALEKLLRHSAAETRRLHP